MNKEALVEIKKGDFVDIGITICGLPKLLVVRTVHRDNTVTLEDFGKYYGRINRNSIKSVEK